jgi:hypothetical protein
VIVNPFDLTVVGSASNGLGYIVGIDDVITTVFIKLPLMLLT